MKSQGEWQGILFVIGEVRIERYVIVWEPPIIFVYAYLQAELVLEGENAIFLSVVKFHEMADCGSPYVVYDLLFTNMNEYLITAYITEKRSQSHTR